MASSEQLEKRPKEDTDANCRQRVHCERSVTPGARGDVVKLMASAFGLSLGIALHLGGLSELAGWLWGGATLTVLLPTFVTSARDLRRGRLGVDVIAILSMALALALREPLPGAVVALMLCGGQALERYAMERARRELCALLGRVPRIVHRMIDGVLADVPIEAVVKGDLLLVKAGEVVPTDGVVLSTHAAIDPSALTGESRTVSLTHADQVQSGVVNVGQSFELRATSRAADSTFAAITRLVSAAASSKAPIVALADRYALGLLAVTAALATVAYLLSHDPLRVLAVLVVATPCPLILAIPIATMAGIARAARQGVLIKGGAQLQMLADVSVLLLDKTGTVTASHPEVVSVESLGELSADELVRLAASVDQLSTHPTAHALLTEASRRGLTLAWPLELEEVVGLGARGILGGQHVGVGQLTWLAAAQSGTRAGAVTARARVAGLSAIYVSVESYLEGAILLQDPLRAEAPRVLRSLRAEGIRRIDLVTGDHPDVADLIGDALGVDRVYSNRSPLDKIDLVERSRSSGLTMVVGDGINDAPALALADCGVAMGARGSAAAAEAADVVLTVDRLDGLLAARQIASHTRKISLQSAVLGMGASMLAMVVAALGWLPATNGALLQEVIDVVAILNALRALGSLRPRPTSLRDGMASNLARDHHKLRAQLERMVQVAAKLDRLEPQAARTALEEIRALLEREVLPHERSEQESAYPIVRALSSPEDPTGPLIQTHHEIKRLARLYGRLLDQLPAGGPEREDLHELRRSLYGLYAVLTLHCAQEDELYSLLQPAAAS